MSQLRRDDLLPQLRQEIDRLLLQRVRLGLALVFGGILLFAVVDWEAGRQLAWLYTVKTVGLAMIMVAYAVSRRSNIASRANMLAWLTVATTCAATALSGSIVGESTGTTILCVSATLISAMLFPWGPRPQLAAVAAAATAIGVNFYWVHGGMLPPEIYGGTAATLAALGMSVGLTYELQRHRVGLMRENLERQRAEHQVMTLNEDLERRVRERTADLEALASTLSNLIESSGDAIWSIDRAHRLVTINSLARQQFHKTYGTELTPGISFSEHLPEESRIYWRNLYDRALGGERFTIEQSSILDNTLRHFLTTLNPLTVSNKTLGVTIFAKDITDLKQAEAASRQHQADLAHVLRLGTMGEIVAGLAHEINQPLGAITNYAGGCQRRMQSGTLHLADVGEVIDRISEEALRAGEILRRVRRLIRKEPMRCEAIDVNAVVSDAARVMRSEAHLRGTTIRLALAPELPTVNGDGIQIEQVMVNLLLNAVEALESVPSSERDLAVRTSLVDGAAIEVSVRDTGGGLAAPISEMVFAPFVTTKANGLGMGLAISRSIIDAHNGRLWVQPNPDRGSTFHFTLPLA